MLIKLGKHFVRFFLFLTLLLLSTSGFASILQPFEFTGGESPLVNQVSYLVDSNGELPVEKVVRGHYDQQFSRFETRSTIAQSKDTWFRIAVHNQSASKQPLFLNLQGVLFTEAELVYINQDGELERSISGLKYDFSTRPVSSQYLSFPLPVTHGESQVFYLRILTPFKIYFSPTITDWESFVAEINKNASYGHLFVGLLLGVLVYLLILAVNTEFEAGVAYFSLFVFFAMLVMLYVNGSMMRYLPGNEWLNPKIWLILHAALQTSYILVSQKYFHLRERYPRLNTYLNGCIVFSVGLLIALFFVPLSVLNNIELLFVFHLLLLLLAMNFHVWFKQKENISLFIIGNIGLLVSAALSTVGVTGVSVSQWMAKHAFEFGFCWQAVFFSMALSGRIKRIRNDQNRLLTEAAVASAESKAKSDFIAKMSHEIRTPMNGVLGMVQLLHTTRIDEEQKHYLNVIDSSGKTLLAVINDILDYSKLIAGKAELVYEDFDLEQMLAELNTLFGNIAHGKGLAFNIIFDESAPTRLHGDSTRLRQVLTNLLSNAFKFTDQGAVILKVKSESLSGGRCVLGFVVQDTGIGITEEEQKNLFVDFSQVDMRLTRRYGGTGLGLSICKQFVEMMGGDITVESVYGKGTEFSFSAEMKISEVTNNAQEEPVTTQQDSETKRDKKILVAEDNDINRDVIAGFLNKMGYTPDFASNGKQAVDEVLGDWEKYDLVLMDCEMPLMDGLTATRRIREFEANKLGGARLRIIALTAHASSEYLKNCLDEGMDGYLCKPVTYDQLRTLVTEELDR